MNTYYLKRMVKLTVELHQLIKDGKDESVEGENVRNDMDHYRDYLSEDDQDWLRQFSASLYKLWENTDNG